jgi:hypothetical protein
MLCRALLVLMTLASVADADPRRIVAVLDVHVEGVPREIAEKFQTDLERKLDSRAYWLAPASRVREMMSNSTKWTEGCVIGPCLAEVKIQTGAEVVLLATITGSGTSFGYVVTLVRTDTGRYLGQAAERCDVCTVNEALTAATSAAVKLLTEMPETLPDETAEHHAAMDLATSKLEQSNERLKKRQERLAKVLILSGLAVAAGGASLYFTQDHASYGLATAGIGAGIAAGGILAMTF